MKVILSAMYKIGLMQMVIRQEKDTCDKGLLCDFHETARHSVEDCMEFKLILQRLTDMKLIQSSHQCEGYDVNMVTKSPIPLVLGVMTLIVTPLPTLEPLVIHYTEKIVESVLIGFEPIVI